MNTVSTPASSSPVTAALPADALWSGCRERLSQELKPQQFSMWIEGLSAEDSPDGLRILAPNTFVQDWVRRNFGDRIKTLVEQLAGADVEIIYSVRAKKKAASSETPAVAPDATPETVPAETPAVSAEAATPAAPAKRSKTKRSSADSGSQLDPQFTFETYVTGKANQLARAAAIQVSEQPADTYNPLFVYGGVGLGKTHLIQAIGNHLLARDPSMRVRYLHAETYVSDVVHATQHHTFDELKRYYNSIDLLLIDDIQFLRGKERTQEQFFFLFNSMVNAHKQVVITSDTYPREMQGIDERLTSRFAWGLIVALDPPELEMRVAILLQKAAATDVKLDEQVAFFIAKYVRSNVRELEGALKRVIAYARFHACEISLAMAREALRDLIAVQNRQVSVENIQKTVSEYYKIPIADMRSKKRSRAIARPRQVAMALSKELTDLSLPEIGLRFGGRDHTTVMHACRQIALLRESDPELGHDVAFLLQVLRS
jgi:chromosomal replication initiator protein